MVGSVIVRVCPDELITAARHLSTVQVDVDAANMAASVSTTRIAAAAHDEVSGTLASLFSTYGQQFHAQVAQAGVNGVQQFAQRLASAATSYSSAEAASAATMFQDQIGLLLNEVAADVAVVIFTPFFLAAALFFVLAIFLNNVFGM